MKKTTEVSGIGHTVGGDGSTVQGGKVDRSSIAREGEGGSWKWTLFWTSATTIAVAIIGAVYASKPNDPKVKAPDAGVSIPAVTPSAPTTSLPAPSVTAPPSAGVKP